MNPLDILKKAVPKERYEPTAKERGLVLGALSLLPVARAPSLALKGGKLLLPVVKSIGGALIPKTLGGKILAVNIAGASVASPTIFSAVKNVLTGKAGEEIGMKIEDTSPETKENITKFGLAGAGLAGAGYVAKQGYDYFSDRPKKDKKKKEIPETPSLPMEQENPNDVDVGSPLESPPTGSSASKTKRKKRKKTQNSVPTQNITIYQESGAGDLNVGRNV